MYIFNQLSQMLMSNVPTPHTAAPFGTVQKKTEMSLTDCTQLICFLLLAQEISISEHQGPLGKKCL